GLASVVVEAVTAGRAAGLEDFVRTQIAAMLAGDGEAVIDRFLNGTQKHAARRSFEMRSTSGYIVVKHVIGGRTYHSVYVHMWNATTHVKAGSVVKAGQQIGLVGSSGPSTAPHLHLEVWEGAWYTGTSLDSTTWLKARGVDLKGNAGRVYSSVVPSSCSYYAAKQVSLLSQPNAAALPLVVLPVNTQMTGVPADMSNGYVRVTAKGLTGWVA
ncbi:M23 family metallopeptidase, partial [Thermocatellispora tengchongensis]|uniref:M23 family metallopeptidase n=1 Tax=Thermocatellispora tengchongensis TaxID=1073253 RepID=UPI0031E7905E